MAESVTKLVFIVCEEGFEPDVMAALARLGLPYYTRWTDCMGAGVTGIRQGTAVWPGLNSVIMALLSAESVEPLWAMLKVARDSFPVTPGVKLIVSDAVMLE